MRVLCFAVILTAATAATIDWDDKLVAKKIKLASTWVDSEAHHMLDIAIVLDESGSVGAQDYDRAKQWIRSFLDFFSISNQFTQVGLVTFSTKAHVRIPINRGIDKCAFLNYLQTIPYDGGATNLGDGLNVANKLLTQAGRPHVPRKLIVVISDGWHTTGPDPFAEQRAFVKKFPKSYFMVVAIGAANNHLNELSKLATKDSQGNQMIYSLRDFKKFAHVAYYFHKGEQGSQLFAVDKAKCANPTCDSGSKSFCACDSLGRGEYECGCPAGHFSVSNAARKQDQCKACPLGEYISSKSARRTCIKCRNPEMETTSKVGSTSKVNCLCKAGFVNAVNLKDKKPPCARISCQAPEIQLLDRLNVDVMGSCQFKYGSKCSYKCQRGTAPANKETMSATCDVTGQWTHAFPQCLPIYCSAMVNVPHSQGWKCVASDGLKLYQHGTQCSTACVDGYKPKRGTSTFRMCTADGSWSGSGLQCEPRTCSALPNIPNGGYVLPQCSFEKSTRGFGLTCQAHCNSGYKLKTGGATSYTCTAQGNWDVTNRQAECLDIKAPIVERCASSQHQYLDNEEGMSYARLKVSAPTATDNSGKTPSVSLSIKTPDDQVDDVDYSKEFQFPIGTSRVTFTFTDDAGNKGYCGFEVTVKDVEAPKVISCDGPVTKNSYIYTKDSTAVVNWPDPVFTDNSGKKVTVYTTSVQGEFGLATYNIIYTATDAAGNAEKCSFKFTVIGQPCPPLHVPYNGALACDKMSFGTVCASQCQRGLAPFYPLEIRPVREYFCTLQGTWRPSHAYVPDCSIQSELEDDVLLTFEGECEDEETKRQIQMSTFKSLQDSFLGNNFIQSTGLTADDIHVQCGAKNESIIDNPGSRRKRAATMNIASSLSSDDELADVLSRSKRELTAKQLEALKNLLGGKISVSKRPCSAGSELRTNRGRKSCYKCAPGSYWSGISRKCTKCPVGTYSSKDATIGRCTACSPGTTTATVGAGNATLCVEQCPFGHYSFNGLMYPVNCKACPRGMYASRLGTRQCTKCPGVSTTSDSGAKNVTYCQAKCTAGYFSHNGLAPCQKCPLNTYQTLIGQKTCFKCAPGQSTLAKGSTKRSQCLIINECNSNPCRNGGSCIDGINRFICNCPAGWTGDRCETNVNECASTPCWSGATCIDKLNDFSCKCPPGFQGKLCNLNINECQTKPCTNGGICIDLEGDFECSCKAGFGGKTCTINQDDCSPGICQNGGVCKDKLNGFICNCATGYRGEQCTENIDDCASNNCLNGASCVDGVNRYTCKCAPGYTGSRCEVNYNDCASRPCRNRGQCTDAVNDYRCTCPNNWGNKDCSAKLSDCFNLDMNANSIEDYVVYDPATKIPTMSEITVKFSMRSNDKGLTAHYGTILSYGLPGKEGMFNIRAFPEQMLQVNNEDWLTGVDVTDNKWNTVCMTWRASDGVWRAYAGAGTSLRLVANNGLSKILSKSKPIQGGGKFVIGQLYQGQEREFNEGNIYQGELSGLSIWYKYDQCILASTPSIAWPNLVYNGKIIAQTNKNMVRKNVRRDQRC